MNQNLPKKIIQKLLARTKQGLSRYLLVGMMDLAMIPMIAFSGFLPIHMNKNLISPTTPLTPITVNKGDKEVFGFAPYWTFNNLDNVDFNTLTTLAYFGVPVLSDGSLDQSDQGYITFQSKQATNIFKKAHAYGTRVVLTLTQMNNQPILNILDDPAAQDQTITQAVTEVKNRGIDGINVDFEYGGDPGENYREKFSQFVTNLTSRMHQEILGSKVTVSVYAASAKDPKIYDIAALSKASDGIFMMAYDFANASSDTATPTAPLYGSKNGKYWYDVSTAVDDFLKEMPANKLILGVPYYGYSYPVSQPETNAQTLSYWGGTSNAQMYSIATDTKPDMVGWDDEAQVGWKAYHNSAANTWRMIFLDDPKSLSKKYDFAINKNLAGVGIWALGFDKGTNDLWKVLSDKFGKKIANADVTNKPIRENYE